MKLTRCQRILLAYIPTVTDPAKFSIPETALACGNMSTSTVRIAYNRLEHLGLIETKRGDPRGPSSYRVIVADCANVSTPFSDFAQGTFSDFAQALAISPTEPLAISLNLPDASLLALNLASSKLALPPKAEPEIHTVEIEIGVREVFERARLSHIQGKPLTESTVKNIAAALKRCDPQQCRQVLDEIEEKARDVQRGLYRARDWGLFPYMAKTEVDKMLGALPERKLPAPAEDVRPFDLQGQLAALGGLRR